MRVLLVSTTHPLDENPLPPLSLAYLAGALEKDGFEVQILDLLVARYRPEKLAQKVTEYRPHLVGVTCVTMNYPLATEMLNVCKNVDADIFTVIGGPHVSFALEDTLLKSPWVDAVVIGEGDQTVVELARAVAGGGGIGGVPGIAFAENGAVVRTQPRPLTEDVDRLAPPARRLVPLARYHALGTPCTVVTSRGCPYGCAFCSASQMFGRKVRFRDPGLVVDEIESIRRDLGFREINIVDDTFTVNRAHVRAICEEMLRRGLDISWSAYARVDNMTDDLAALMKRAGCHMVLFGIESADEGILKTIRKGITPDDMRKGVKTATGAGLRVYTSFIIGLPGESLDTIRKSMAFAAEVNEAYGAEYGYHMLSPLPGTDLYDRAAEYGIRILTDDWAQFDANRPIVQLPNMGPELANQAMAVYEDILDKAWVEIRRGAEAGDARYIARLEAKERREFIWGLLQEDAVEALGPVAPAGVSLTEAEKEMAARVAGALGQPVEVAQRQLRKLVERGLLQPGQGDDGFCWRWSEGPGRADG